MRALSVLVLIALSISAGFACGGESDSASQADDELRDRVANEASEHGWAAGCAWPIDEGPDDAAAPLTFLGLDGELTVDYATGTLGNDAEDRYIATLHRIDYTGPESELERVDVGNAVCFRSTAE